MILMSAKGARPMLVMRKILDKTAVSEQSPYIRLGLALRRLKDNDRRESQNFLALSMLLLHV